MIAADSLCLDDDQLRDLTAGRLPGDRFANLMRHLDRCPECQRRASEMDAGEDSFLQAFALPVATDPFAAEPDCLAMLHAAARPQTSTSQTSTSQTSTSQTSTSQPPIEMLGPYRLHHALGSGGMGAVFLASHTRLRRQCAIKLLPRDRAADANWRDRFDREMAAVANLNHPRQWLATLRQRHEQQEKRRADQAAIDEPEMGAGGYGDEYGFGGMANDYGGLVEGQPSGGSGPATLSFRGAGPIQVLSPAELRAIAKAPLTETVAWAAVPPLMMLARPLGDDDPRDFLRKLHRQQPQATADAVVATLGRIRGYVEGRGRGGMGMSGAGWGVGFGPLRGMTMLVADPELISEAITLIGDETTQPALARHVLENWQQAWKSSRSAGRTNDYGGGYGGMGGEMGGGMEGYGGDMGGYGGDMGGYGGDMGGYGMGMAGGSPAEADSESLSSAIGRALGPVIERLKARSEKRPGSRN